MSRDYDLIVIGAGSGGVRLSRMAAAHGARVAVVESAELGGTCVNVGCVPKKLFVYASHVRDDAEDARGFGWNLHTDKAVFDWAKLRDNKNREISRLNTVYGKLLENSNVSLFKGQARLLDPHTVQVDSAQSISADRIAIATGSFPHIPRIPGHEHLLTSNDMFFLDRLPSRAVVWGGGYIAVEFAGILSGLGVETTLIYRGDLFLRGFDEDVRHFVADEMRKSRIQLLFNSDIKSVERQGDSFTLSLSDGTTWETDLILAATGRSPLTQNLGLEALEIALGPEGQILVDEHFRTSIASIFALGDVIGTPQLTPVALAQAMVLSRQLFGDGQGSMQYRDIPTAVFCQPNIASVGMTELEALKKGQRLRVYVSQFKPMKQSLSGRDERTLMKLIVDDHSDKVLGVHIAGADAGEIVQGFAVALKAGATKTQFDATLGIHPTAAEELVTMRQPTRFVG